MHPGTNMVTTYYGYTWWDNETDGKLMYPAEQRGSGEAQRAGVRGAIPRQRRCAATVGGPRSSSKTSARLSSTRSSSTRSSPISTATAGSSARSTSATARATCSTQDDKVVPHDDPEKFGKAVHLKDIHLEKGMHCVDCHFEQDNHGNGKLYGETRNAVEIDCVDCHGTLDQRATLHDERPGGAGAGHARSPRCARRSASAASTGKAIVCISGR